MHQHKHLRFIQKWLHFLSLGVFQGQLDSHFFFSCFYGRAGGEDGFAYQVLLFLLYRLHACAIQERRQVNHTLPSSIVRINPLLQQATHAP